MWFEAERSLVQSLPVHILLLFIQMKKKEIFKYFIILSGSEWIQSESKQFQAVPVSSGWFQVDPIGSSGAQEITGKMDFYY